MATFWSYTISEYSLERPFLNFCRFPQIRLQHFSGERQQAGLVRTRTAPPPLSGGPEVVSRTASILKSSKIPAGLISKLPSSRPHGVITSYHLRGTVLPYYCRSLARPSLRACGWLFRSARTCIRHATTALFSLYVHGRCSDLAIRFKCPGCPRETPHTYPGST